MEKKRVYFLDIAKGIGIILTIIGHYEFPRIIHDWINAFHMPLFFIIAGYFWHERPLMEEFKKGIRQLICPMVLTKILWVILLLVVYNYKGIYTGPDSKDWLLGGLFEMGDFHMAVVWFLLALFWGKIIMNLLQYVKEKMRVVISVILFIISYSIRSYLDQGYGIYFPFCFFQGLTVPVFMLIGYYLHKYEILEKKFPLSLVIIAFISLIMAYKMPIYMAAIIYPHSFWNVVSASFATISLLYFCNHLPLFQDKNTRFFKVITFIGRNSLAVLCIHALEFSIQLPRIFNSFIPNYLHGITMVIIISCIVYILRNIPFVQKIYHIQ